VWALQEGGAVAMGGRSNRSAVAFEQEMDAVVEAVPLSGAEKGPGEALMQK
jgi:hypothetical protein